MRAAILHHHLAIDVAGGIGNQETREIGKLAMFADAAERIFRSPSVVAALGPKLACRAGGRKRAGRDRDGTDAPGPPLHRQAPGHGENGGLGHRGRHREGAAGNGRGRQDAQHHAFVSGFDPALARTERAIHRAVQRRRENRVGGAERQLLGLRDEGCGGVVDQHIERRIAPDRVHHGVDSGPVANVAADRGHLAAKFAAHLSRGRLQQFEPAAADDQFGAKLDEAASHRSAEPGAAAGDQDALSRQQAFFKHR